MASKTISVRLPEETVHTLSRIADERFIPLRTILRAWIMERLEAETGETKRCSVD